MEQPDTDACDPAAMPAGTNALTEAVRALRVLVVDDSAAQRRMLGLLLRKWQFDVTEAEDGAEALAICEEQPVDMIISDWMMPNMTGLELCKQIRAHFTDSYIYFILLTSRSEKSALTEGLEAGADDFLTKPTDAGEMQARMRAGQRLIMMQDDLIDKNRRITEAFDKLQDLYQSIDRDLKAAARLQSALIPDASAMCGPVPFGVIYRPAGHVGGDLLGYFQVSRNRVCAYSIDVSGHGVSSALLTARLSNLFNTTHFAENIAVMREDDGSYRPRDPAIVMTELNDRMQDEADNDQYFTMLFADINLTSGLVRYCQAAHPNPAVIRATGEIEFIGEGGPPVGLMPGMTYETQVAHLAWGDRLMMFSDGIVECEDDDGELLDNEGLEQILTQHWGMSEHEVLEQVIQEMAAFRGNDDFDDDVSALMLTMPG